MGAYLRFFERRVEWELSKNRTRGFSRPPAAESSAGQPAARPTAFDRRQHIPPLGLREYWYPALPARRVPRKKPLYWRMLGEEIAFFRDREGNVVAISDICPHRGASMSKGWCFYKGTLACPYHGAAFDGEGECKAFLSEGPDSKMVGNMRARAYPTRTLRGWVFIWMGEGEPAPLEKDVPPELFDKNSTLLFHTYTYWYCSWIMAIENQGDAHNGFYLHRNSLAQLTMKRLMRARTPMGPSSKLVNEAALISLMKNQTHYADADGNEPFHLYYPGVDGVWPVGQWRKWLWNLFRPWMKVLYNPWRAKSRYKSTQEWGENPGSQLWHLPSMIRVNNGYFMLTRYAVPISENLSRIVYFNHRTRSSAFVTAVQTIWYYLHFNWWFHYNFSGQDGWATAQCRYWTDEFLSATDSHLVMLRKLITERSRDVLRRRSSAAAVPEVRSAAEQRLFDLQRKAGIEVENSLDRAAQITETEVAIETLPGIAAVQRTEGSGLG